jgi:Carbohydrate-binding module 48 (Isoamylase N-terminal domain)
MRVCRENPYPLGATWDGRAVNFAVFSETAEKIDVCLGAVALIDRGAADPPGPCVACRATDTKQALRTRRVLDHGRGRSTDSA